MRKIEELLQSLNNVPRVQLKQKEVNQYGTINGEPRELIKGYFQGIIYSTDSPVFRRLKILIESHGFIITEYFILEELDEGFTNLSFTLKPQKDGIKKSK